MGTILAWTAPFAALSALIGLWRSTDQSTRRVWRTLAIVTALGSAVVMALIVLPNDAAQASFLAASGMYAGLLYGAGLWLGMLALLVDEYRRPALVGRFQTNNRLWHDITRELTSHDSLDTMLLNIAGAFRRDVAGDCAHVFKISGSRRAAYRTGTIHASADIQSENPETAPLLTELAWWGAQEDEVAMVSGADGVPILTLPLRDDGTTYAMILVQNPQHAPQAEWRLAAAMVARTMSDWCEIAEHRDRGLAAKRMTKAMPTLMANHSLETALKAIDAALSGVVEYDYLSVSSLGASRAHEDRATMLAGTQRMIENRHRWPVVGATLERVLAGARAVITPDLDMAADDDDSEVLPWERRLGMRSRLIAPICDGSRAIGSITLAHRRFARYSETDVDLVATIAAFLAPWMRQVDSVRRFERHERVLAFQRQIESQDTAALDDAALVNEASSAIDATGLRVYRLDSSKQTLNEIATGGRLPNNSPSRELPLALLPWHRWALESRRTLSVDQGAPESVMSHEEATLAMHKTMKTGCLVPIVAKGQPIGMIDVVERRHPDRSALDSGSKMVLETLATILAQRWETLTTDTQSHDSAGAVSNRLRGWSRQIVNPLTAIIGSSELIRYKEPRLGVEAIKYLGTIERAASRIHESLLAILEEAAAEAGESSILVPRERTQTRSSETSRLTPTEFARPASLSEAAMRSTESMPLIRAGQVFNE